MPTAIFKTSHKENEKRIPIYPEDICKIDKAVLSELIFEKNYGIDYGFSDDYLEKLGCKFAYRSELFVLCDTLILPKPTIIDFLAMKPGQTMCGWNHAVQQQDIAEVAVQKGLTLISWENMNHVSPGSRLHIFYRNNELAGYAAVLHYLQLEGIDGFYGSRKKVLVLGYGSVSRGAIYALQGRGFNDITIYTKRSSHLVIDKSPNACYKCFIDQQDFRCDLSEADIIINGILQDVSNPMMFSEGIGEFKVGAGIIDISCDEGMGFTFAVPTTFEEPIIYPGRGIKY